MSIRNLFRMELRRLVKRRRIWATLGVLILVFGACDARLFAQRSNVEKREGGKPSASSILAGDELAKGGVAGVDRSRSKFNGGAVYGDANAIVGIDGTGSRFDGGSRFRSSDPGPFRSSQDFTLLRKSAERRKAIVNSLTSKPEGRDVAPRLVVASKPARVPYASNRKARYGVVKDELAERARLLPDKTTPQATVDAQDALFREELEARNAPSPREIWMRGRLPNLGSVRPDVDRRGEEFGELPYVDDGSALYYDDASWQNNGLGGDLGLSENLFETSSLMRAPIVQTPTPAETRQAFQGYLEAQLLRSPSVNPLSPIQVVFNDGVAVVQGVVPTPSARVAAGNILLADPRVQRVENRLTFVRPDDAELAPPTRSDAASN